MYTFTHKKYMDDATLKGLYDQMKAEGLYDKVFYSDQHPTAETFIKHVRKNCWLVLVTEGPLHIAVFWLSKFSDLTAQFHYWVYKAGWGAPNLQRETIQYIEENLKDVSTLIGCTPSANRLALRYLKKGGFTVLGEVPGSMKFKDGTIGAATISYRSLR